MLANNSLALCNDVENANLADLGFGHQDVATANRFSKSIGSSSNFQFYTALVLPRAFAENVCIIVDTVASKPNIPKKNFLLAICHRI